MTAKETVPSLGKFSISSSLFQNDMKTTKIAPKNSTIILKKKLELIHGAEQLRYICENHQIFQNFNE